MTKLEFIRIYNSTRFPEAVRAEVRAAAGDRLRIAGDKSGAGIDFSDLAKRIQDAALPPRGFSYTC